MRALLRALIHERVVMTVIVLNAVTAFLHAFQSFPAPIRDGLYWIDYGCAVFFVIEIATKVSFRGWSSFWEDGWNRFDFIVVALSLPYLLSPTPLFNLEGLGAILLLRLGRLLRLLRLVHFIPNQEEIQQGIARALRASVGVFLALFLYTFTLTLFSYSLFHGHAPQYFGDPLTALYSMFQIFTVEGWYEIPNRIAQQSGWAIGGFARVYFAFTVLTGGIIGLSLANAVFVDEMVIDNTRDLEDDVDEIQDNLRAHMRQSQEKREKLETMIADLHERLETEETVEAEQK
jgi:voltage-gated sodium channel